MQNKIRVISRYSALAKIQVKEIFEQLPDLKYELNDVKTMGDKDKESSLIDNPNADFFTREIDQALLSGGADVAIHSAKDMPYPLPKGLQVYALTKAADKSDCLATRGNIPLSELPATAKIGTSSKQRKQQILECLPTAKIVSIRGTIEERLSKLDSGEIDALIVATCALQRLGLRHRISEILPFAPHPLQGNLAVVGKVEQVELAEQFSSVDIKKNFAKVTMMGFGPGDAEYITIKGRKALKKADVIFYDDLIDKQFLSNFLCEKVYVGKRKGNHSKDQTEICELLYQSAIAGKNTVRLKGGDPAIFGRLGEELDYLRERLIDVEVIPGITTASAATALIGMSLTQRGLSKSVAYITGHNPDEISLPNTETIVFYMAGTNFHKISEKLLANGWHKNTQVAIISNVSMPNQKVYINELHTFTEEQEFVMPAIILVSKVVNKALIEAYLNDKPKVLVTGTKAEKYSNLGKVIHTPLLSISPLPFNAEVFVNIKKYNYIIFTSIHTVKYFFKYLLQSGKDLRHLANTKIVSVGQSTTKQLKKQGLIPDFEPENQSSEGIVNLFKQNKISNKSILLPRSNIALPVIPEGLQALGNKVDIYTLYKNEFPEHFSKVDLNEFKYVVFSSPSCVSNFKRIYHHFPEHLIPINRGAVTQKAFNNAFAK